MKRKKKMILCIVSIILVDTDNQELLKNIVIDTYKGLKNSKC